MSWDNTTLLVDDNLAAGVCMSEAAQRVTARMQEFLALACYGGEMSRTTRFSHLTLNAGGVATGAAS
jgi:hypothetical protein